MRTVLDIYEEYRIPPWLQMHQLRVAAVGQKVAEKIEGVTVRDVVLTGLFHDMGNILKFDLTDSGRLAAVVSSEDLEKWRAVQAEYTDAYGHDEHVASIEIGKKIGLQQHILDMIDNMRFSRTLWVLNEANMEMKVVKYADLRVGPIGVLPLRERLDEANARYQGKTFDTGDRYDASELEGAERACADLEMVLMETAGMDAREITDESIEEYVQKLREFQF